MTYASLEHFRDVTSRNVLALQEAREKGRKVVGQFCIYSPLEIALAAGAVPVSLCGTKQDSIPVAEEVLPRCLCPLIKSSFGFALQDSCPYLAASDIVVADATCDGKKKMYELLAAYKPVMVLQLPQIQDERAHAYWREQYALLVARLEQDFGVQITEEKLRAAMDLTSRLRQALKKVLDKLAVLVEHHTAPDLMICNYVYEHVEDGTSHTVRYTNVFPQNRLFSWMHVGHFRPDQNLLMHSVMYRTQVLRQCGMVLPKHTFYVDNIFVYQPLPYVKSMYYMDLDLYRYFIGRADQSVNESVMVKRVDQQLRVTRHMIDCQDLDALQHEKRLRAYMLHYLSMMMTVSDIFLLLDGTPEAYTKKKELWQYLKDHVSPKVYRSVVLSLGGVTNVSVPGGDKVVLGCYRLARKLFKFN